MSRPRTWFFQNRDALPSIPLLLWTVPILLSMVVGLFTIDGQFVLDDFRAIKTNPFITGDAPYTDAFRLDFWGAPLTERVLTWRPLLPMAWKFLWKIGAGSPLPFRIVSLLLHVAATGLVLLVGQRLLGHGRVSWVAGCLFAVHAVHAEAIGGIVSHTDLLATAFGLLALLTVINGRTPTHMLLTTLLLAAAYLAKESAVIFGVTIMVTHLAASRRSLARRLVEILPIIVITGALISFQLSLVRAPQAATWQNNIAYGADCLGKILHGLYIVGKAITMCFVPVGLAPTHNYGAIALAPGMLLPYAIPGLLFLLIGGMAAHLAVKNRSTVWMVIVCLLFGPVVLQSSLIVIVQTELAERLLYPASVASCLMTAIIIDTLRARNSMRSGLVILLILALLGQSWRAQRPWHDPMALQTHAITTEPLSWRAQYGYGIQLLRHDRQWEGMWHIMLGSYILSQFPRQVSLDPLSALDKMPLRQRVIEAPALLQPQAPCGLLNSFIIALREFSPSVARVMEPIYLERYAPCFTLTP